MSVRSRIATNSAPSASSSGELDAQFAVLLEQITNEMMIGGLVDVEALLSEYPQHAEQFERLLPALRAIADLGQSASRSSGAGHAPTAAGGLEYGVLGDFRIVREIGRGGMGIVYEAEQISLSRRVALKVLPFAALLDERQLGRFRNESQAVAMLRHPHIVGVHCVGCERGVHYYAMDLIDGPTLAEVIQSRSPTAEVENRERPHDTVRAARDSTVRSADDKPRLAQAARIIVQAADALDYAHQCGVVHRDIKPSNLLLDAAGGAWITDFGLAQVQTGQNLTMTGDLLGTLRYMSPEQAAGDRVVLDQRTDVYSLGVTLYELLTLKPAFPDEDRRVLLRRIIDEEPPMPSRLNPLIPRDLETIVLKATAKSPADRYQTAGQLRDDLRRFLEHRPILARRTTYARRLRYWARRNPGVAALTTTVFLLLLTLSIGGPALAWRYAAAARSERDARAAVSAQAEESRRQLYHQGVYGSYEAIRAGNVALAEQLIAAQIPQPGQSDLREFCWAHMSHVLEESKRRTIFDAGVPIQAMCMTQDGERFVLGTRDGNIILLHVATGHTESIRAHDEAVNGLVISDDNRTLYSASDDGTVRRWDLSTLAPIGEPLEHADGVFCLAVSPSRPLLVAGLLGGGVTVWDLETSQPLQSVAAHAGWVMCVRFAPDGQTFVTGSQDHTVQIWNAETLQRGTRFDADRTFVRSLLFSPDGQRLMIGGREGVKCWDLASNREVPGSNRSGIIVISLGQINETLLAASNWSNSVSLVDLRSGYSIDELHGHRHDINSLAVTPDGRTLYSASNDGTVKAWDLTDAIRRANSTDPDDGLWAGGLAFSPNGSRVATATHHLLNESTETVEVLNARTGSVELSFSAPLGNSDCVAWSPDGNWLATAGKGAVVIWDAFTGHRRLVVSDLPDQCFEELRWSADGRWLAAVGGTRPWGESENQALVAIWHINDSATQAHEVHRYVDPNPKSYAESLSFSPTGKQLAVGISLDKSETRLWEFVKEAWRAPAEPMTIHEGWTCHVAFVGNDLVASASTDHIVNLYSVTQQRVVRWMTSAGDIFCLSASPDGRNIAAGSPAHVQFWDVDTGSNLANVPILPWVAAVQFSHDGKTFTWKGGDRVIHFLRTE